jgi:hypothetical protein
MVVALACGAACAHRPSRALGPIAQPECDPPDQPQPLAEQCGVLCTDAKAPRQCPTYDAWLAHLLRRGDGEFACAFGGVREGECGGYKVIDEPGKYGGRYFYFDASGVLVGILSWSDIALPCDLRALDPAYSGPLKPGTTTATEWGRVPRCHGSWAKHHCREYSK